MTKHHDRTFRLLGMVPERTKASEVNVVEARLGIRLPKSAKDWYSRNEAIRILAEHSNDDPPIPLGKFRLVNWQDQILLPIRDENQGVCQWAILLNGSDDPPVYVDVDSQGTRWQLSSPSFSDYVYSCVWDYRMVFGPEAGVQAQNKALSKKTCLALRRDFVEELQTFGWPASIQYRFQGDNQAILVWAGEDQADWFIAAGSAELLSGLLRKIWSLDSLGDSLYGMSEIADNVLNEIRRG